MKVNVELLRQLQKSAAEAQSLYLAAASEHYPFCDQCGETDPVNGFYPLGIGGPGSISGLICNDCRQEKEPE